MLTWTAIATPGLEPVVARELADLGVSGEVEAGAVTFGAPLADGAQLARALRTPSRLLVTVATGEARNLDALARLVRAADWRPFLSRKGEVEVSATSRRSRLRHRDAIEKKVGFAIADARRRLPPGRGSPQRVQVRLVDDRVTVTIDAGGERLDRRGWRKAAGKAPLRENLAASMLIAAGWEGDEALVDPFCGAGTLPIEGALLASGRPPWVDRHFACDGWPGLRREGGDRGSAVRVPILGADKDARVLLSAEDNARRARVRIDWRHLDVGALEPPAPTGLVVANPPYGERLGQQVAGVYSTFGRTLRERFGGWRCAFLAPDPSLARRVHRDAERLTVFANGGIRVGLWAVEIA